MLGLITVVVLGTTLLVGDLLARRTRLAPPVLLLAAGGLLGFVPALRGVRLPPEAVLLLFLPALLFWESMTTSLREIRSNLRGVVLNSTALVVLTAAAVAATAHGLGLPWGPAWVLGGALAPTDATAVGALARVLPRRRVTVLRAESLVNDGTALVVYGLAIGVTVGVEHLAVLQVTGLFVLAYAGGAVGGLVTAWVVDRVQRRLDDPLQENVLALVAPFTAYLLAEAVGASGVLAVVVYGLVRSQTAPRQMRADTRQQGQSFWTLATYVLNGALFVLVGLQLQSAVRDLTSVALTRGLLAVAAVSAVVIGTRLAWFFTVPYLIRLLDRRPQQRQRRVGVRGRMVSGVAGFRGAVSLAAALAVPEMVDDGTPFPDRDLVVFVTAGVIVVTLVQGLALPAVVRWARLPRDTSVDEERRLARTSAAAEALAALPRLADELGIDAAVADRANRDYQRRLQVLTDGDPVGERPDADYRMLRLALIAQERATVVRLRDERRIDDTVLRQLQTQLDLEEVGLHHRGAESRPRPGEPARPGPHPAGEHWQVLVEPAPDCLPSDRVRGPRRSPDTSTTGAPMPTWFITGCSTGLGQAFARAVLARGWNAAVTARDPRSLQELVGAHPDTALPLALDVTDHAQVGAAVAAAEERFGAIDVLVNNAGYGYRAALEEGEDADVQQLFATNVFGPVAVTKAALPGMRARRAGTVVNVSSIGAQICPPGSGYYSATKAALEGLSGSLRREVEPLGLRVVVVEPGAFRTDFSGRSIGESATVIDDYADTAGKRRKAHDTTDGTQPGDPAKAAEALITAVTSDQPPALLLLGNDAVGAAADVLQDRQAELERWRELSTSTDLD